MQEVLTLGGRRFEAAAESSTFEQDAYLMGLVLEHGIDKVIAENGDVAGAVLRSGCATQFFVGLLTDAGEEWTLARARENAVFLKTLRETADKAVLFECLRGLLKGFSEAGVASSTALPIASAASSSTTSATPSRTTKTIGRSRAMPRKRDSATGRSSAPRSPTTPTSG